jgi:hypothetical protein
MLWQDRELKLGGLLALNLHEFSSDVEEICDQAIKEEKMENQLKALGERWAVIEWQMELYKDTDVPLLKASSSSCTRRSMPLSPLTWLSHGSMLLIITLIDHPDTEAFLIDG